MTATFAGLPPGRARNSPSGVGTRSTSASPQTSTPGGPPAGPRVAPPIASAAVPPTGPLTGRQRAVCGHARPPPGFRGRRRRPRPADSAVMSPSPLEPLWTRLGPPRSRSGPPRRRTASEHSAPLRASPPHPPRSARTLASTASRPSRTAPTATASSPRDDAATDGGEAISRGSSRRRDPLDDQVGSPSGYRRRRRPARGRPRLRRPRPCGPAAARPGRPPRPLRGSRVPGRAPATGAPASEAAMTSCRSVDQRQEPGLAGADRRGRGPAGRRGRGRSAAAPRRGSPPGRPPDRPTPRQRSPERGQVGVALDLDRAAERQPDELAQPVGVGQPEPDRVRAVRPALARPPGSGRRR